ncbi:hypothetical protein [Candidatus Palauibacter sp.]|uniref:hypothetical protein n=1 Tax=Candidatus Palauibacter sp. TaxID=3101350 RepID=UPI003B51AD7F
MGTREFEIRMERMLLRPHRREDVDDIFEFARDPEWGRYLTAPMLGRVGDGRRLRWAVST